MELRELLNIFSRHRSLFLLTILFFLAAAFVWQQSQPVSYRATLLLNIGRTGVQETPEYTFDNFYRLQADERFADTVVRWLQSPRVVEDIYAEAKLDPATLRVRDLKSIFKSGRLSSQMIEVSYSGGNESVLQTLADSSVSVLNRFAEDLNQEQEKHWFVIIGSDPVIRDDQTSLPFALLAGLLIGLFVGVWAVLLKYYLEKDRRLTTND